MKYTIVLNDQEEKLVDDLKKRGFRKAEIFRQGLRLLHRKEIPIYSKREKDDEGLTPEEICINKGGEVIEENGIRKCRIRKGNLEYYENL